VDGQTVRFTRAGLVEEYSVSMDGVRQDFVVTEKPAGHGPLEVRLAVSGARVEPAPYGAQLVLEQWGRRIAYSRLHATDANGKELPARIELQNVSAFSLEPSAFALSLVVNDAGAAYPVRIDPTFSDANWISMGGLIGADGRVSAAVTDGLGNLYIRGNFRVVGNVVANGIAKWNGSNWSALGSGMNIAPSVYALAVSGGTLYAGGAFAMAGGKGSAYAAEAVVVWPEFQSGPVRNKDASMTLNLVSLPQTTSRLYAATNLSPPVSWQPICSNVTGGLWHFTETNASGNPAKLYLLSTP
jgi:hypothetical protein